MLSRHFECVLGFPRWQRTQVIWVQLGQVDSYQS